MISFADYRIELDGACIVAPCIQITLFSITNLGESELPEMLSPYTTFLDEFQSQIGYCRTSGSQSRPKKFTELEAQKLITQLRSLRHRKGGGLMADIRGGSNPDGRDVPSLYFGYSLIYGTQTCVELFLPLSWFAEQGLTGLCHFLEKSLTDFSLHCGHIGFGLLIDENKYRQLDPYFEKWLLRHPGLNCLGGTYGALTFKEIGLIDMNWFTLLGPQLLATAGGIELLKSKLQSIPDVIVKPLPGGSCAIIIGDMPQLGDTDNGDYLEAYQQVGAILAPLRNTELLKRNFLVWGLSGKENKPRRDKWLSRFIK